MTMYRVVLYGLSFMTVTALGLSLTGTLSYASPGILAGTLAALLAVCVGTNALLSKLYGITSNFESSFITAYILFFVLAAPDKPIEWAGIVLAAIIAIASKYVVTWRGSHIFNPAAFGVLLVSIIGIGSGAWWIATETLFWPMLVVAFLVLFKLRKFQVFFAFLLPAVALIVYNYPAGSALSESVVTALTLFPLLFLGSIMLTEPATMPNTRYLSILFAVIVGLALASNIDIGFIGASPHLALLIGNLFAFIVAMRTGAYLTLVKKTQLTPTTYNFAFEPSRPIPRVAGQYMEFTLPGVSSDSRGNRRTFTVASGPSNKLINIGVKFYDKGSAFKNRLADIAVGDKLMGGHVAGDFTMPEDTSIPLVFVAGGIGITPFIAMVEELAAQNQKRTVDLYYFVADKSEVAYEDVLKAANKAGVTVHPRVGRDARFTADDVKTHPKAHYYLSGPPGMVAAYKSQLQELKVAKIHTDLFTGY